MGVSSPWPHGIKCAVREHREWIPSQNHHPGGLQVDLQPGPEHCASTGNPRQHRVRAEGQQPGSENAP